MVAQKREQPFLIPFRPVVACVRLVMTNLGMQDAIAGLDEEFDVEGDAVLRRDGCLGWRPSELSRLPGVITLRHLVLLICQPARTDTAGDGNR